MGAKVKYQNLKITRENNKESEDGQTICSFVLVAPDTKIQSTSLIGALMAQVSLEPPFPARRAPRHPERRNAGQSVRELEWA